MKDIPAIELIFDSARGNYIPQNFVEECLCYPENPSPLWDFADGDADILLQGPEHELYWEAWESMLDGVTYKRDGFVWRLLYGDSGDLFAICLEKMSIAEKMDWRDVLELDPEAIYQPTGTISDSEAIDAVITAFRLPPMRWRQYYAGPESFWVEILNKEGKMTWRAPTFQPDFMFDLFRAVEYELNCISRGL